MQIHLHSQQSGHFYSEFLITLGINYKSFKRFFFFSPSFAEKLKKINKKQ